MCLIHSQHISYPPFLTYSTCWNSAQNAENMQRLAGKYKFFILIHVVTQPLALAERPYCYKMLLLVVSKEVLWTRPGWSDPIFIFMTRPTIAASWLAGQEGAACLVGTVRRSFLRLDGSDRVSLYSSPPWWPKRTLDAVLASSPSWLVSLLRLRPNWFPANRPTKSRSGFIPVMRRWSWRKENVLWRNGLVAAE